MKVAESEYGSISAESTEKSCWCLLDSNSQYFYQNKVPMYFGLHDNFKIQLRDSWSIPQNVECIICLVQGTLNF